MRSRIRKGGQGRRLGVQIANEEVGRIIAGLAPRHQPPAILVEDADHALIDPVRRGPDALGRARGQVHGRQEGILPCPRRPGPGHQHPRAVGGEPHDREAAGVDLGHREARVVVAVLIVPLQQGAALTGVGWIDQIAGLAPVVELPADHQRRIGVAPDHAAVAVLQIDQRRRRGVERRGEGEDPVTHLGGRARIAAVLGLDPDQGRGRIGPPLGRTRPRRDGVERGRNVVAQRQVGDPVHDHALQVRHHDVGREQGRRDHIAVGVLHRGLQDVAPVRRNARAQIDRRHPEGPCPAFQRHQRQLRGEIVFEQGLVARVGQQVLIRPRRRGAAEALLDDGPRGRSTDVGRGASALRRHPHHQTRTVRQPVKGPATRGVDPGVGQFARAAAGHIHGPQLQPGRRIHQQSQRAAVGRPARRDEARIGRQADRPGGAARYGLEAEAGQPAHPAVGLTVVARIDPVSGQPQHRLGQFGDRWQVGAVVQGQGRPVRRQAGRRCRFGVENVRDRGRRLLIGPAFLRQGRPRQHSQQDKGGHGPAEQTMTHDQFPKTTGPTGVAR